MSNVSESLRSLTKNERWEQIVQVALQKWATMSDSLRLLTKKKQMSESLICLQNSSDSLRNSQPCLWTHHCYPHCQFLFLLIAAVNIFLFFRLWADSFATEKCSSSRRAMFKSSSSWSGDHKGTVHRDFWPPYFVFFSEHFHMNSLKR